MPLHFRIACPKKGDPFKPDNELPFSDVQPVLFLAEEFDTVGTGTGHTAAGLFLPGHFIPAPLFNEIGSFIAFNGLKLFQPLFAVRLSELLFKLDNLHVLGPSGFTRADIPA
jgi:hypothetical protein